MGGTAPRLRCLHQSLDFITQIKSLFKFTDVVSRSKNWPAGKMTFCVTCNAGGKRAEQASPIQIRLNKSDDQHRNSPPCIRGSQ